MSKCHPRSLEFMAGALILTYLSHKSRSDSHLLGKLR